MKRAIILISLALPGAALAAEPVSFATDIAPVLKSRCATCHLTGAEGGGMALHPGKAYEYLVNVPSQESKLLRVKPGAPDESYLIAKLTGTHLDAGGSGARMPFGAPPLADQTIWIIRDWITAGAPKN
jgi:hypothetical protein